MPQMQFPFFPEGVTHITSLLAFSKQDGRVTYFNGNMPVFIHDVDDNDSFRMITAQLCVNGNAKQVDIIRAFGISKISIKRAVKLFREAGPKGFYAKRKTRGAAVLTTPVLEKAQQLLDEGLETPEVADRLGIKRDTLSKAVRAERGIRQTIVVGIQVLTTGASDQNPLIIRYGSKHKAEAAYQTFSNPPSMVAKRESRSMRLMRRLRYVVARRVAGVLGEGTRHPVLRKAR